MKLNNKNNELLWLDYIAVAIIVIAFFVISYFGFFMGDDLSMAHGEFSTLSDVFKHTWQWYHERGGRCFSTASQYFFCGLIGKRIWFDIVNTLFFLLLILTSGKLINDNKKVRISIVLMFALLFWLLCPMPNETLFWVAGSTVYLWANTLTFVFLFFFIKYKDSNFGFAGKLGLFFMSIFAATEFIPCVSICGAFVVYYAFHIKRFKGNAIPFVMGFAIGSLVLLFAPGNFERVESEPSFVDKIKELIFNPIQEIIKYKALWMFLLVLVLGWIKNKMVVKTWMKNNAFLLLSLGWSVVAFGVVFRPANRALFFPETISIVLFLRFLYDNYEIFGIRFFETIFGRNFSMTRNILLTVMFVVFLVDATFAVAETKKQSKNNDVLLNEIADSGGIVALDQMISSHRMAYVPVFPQWTWEPLADRFGLDSVHVYPYYCQDKFYKQAPPLDNIYIDEINYDNDNDVFGKYVRLIVRVENGDLLEKNNHIVFAIDYTRPKKWYKSWLDKLRNYQYDRTEFVERDNPDICFDGYCYYVIWFGRENAKNLKSVNYELN